MGDVPTQKIKGTIWFADRKCIIDREGVVSWDVSRSMHFISHRDCTAVIAGAMRRDGVFGARMRRVGETVCFRTWIIIYYVEIQRRRLRDRPGLGACAVRVGKGRPGNLVPSSKNVVRSERSDCVSRARRGVKRPPEERLQILPGGACQVRYRSH